jgi:hypothetical protein
MLFETDSGRKACSVKELDEWIHQHARFNPAQTDAFLLPETARTLTQAAETAEKIIHITRELYVQEDARAAQRTFGPRSWQPVTGKPCAHALTGVIVIGAGRGTALKVCINKEKCATHWGQWQKERAKRAKHAAQDGGDPAQGRYAKEEARRQAEREREEAQRAQWKTATPALLEAIAARVAALPTKAAGFLAQEVVRACANYGHGWINSRAAARFVPVGKTAEQVLRHAAFLVLAATAANEWHGRRNFAKPARALGINLAALLKEAVPVQKTARGTAAA